MSTATPPNNFQSSLDEDLAWDSMAPVGREFGSPDYDRLIEEDAKKFASDLGRWIEQSSAAHAGLQLEKDEVSDAHNVQLALRELGQDVSIDVAASVWKHYSQSLMAGWMSGAETVESAASTLYLQCPRVSATMEKLLDIAKAIVENSTAEDAVGFDPAAWLDSWLEIPQPSLGGRKPADLIDTPAGLEVVTRLLGAIESGSYQ
ncbi:MbcA/ParS/Xre antitoxin family protein [Rhodoferax sp. BLA1]|uniref:MbcA/ParS/Xre antitoxin family protein n=1 Tax=Rhodoferax sp. BLA1 TaxID=2576062 RepID=UPI00210254F3|nr:MbcA/ParS/Xre antitoxin family protein [Rhodoferax sp. BLA1]